MMRDHEEMTNSRPRQSGSFNRASSAGSSLRRHSFGSFNRASSASSSLRRHSLSSSYFSLDLEDDDIESEAVSEAGDIGDRALHSHRNSERGRLRFSFGRAVENGVVVPIMEDASLQPSGFSSHVTTTSITESAIVGSITPSTLEIGAAASAEGTVQPEDVKKEKEEALPWILEYISCLTFLALFGILGVIARYYLQKLFGPGVVGSFLMGWFGFVFKGDISKVSDNLVIGLTTGFLGSLTTFSGWSQKMLDLSVEGHWVFSVLGIIIGLFLAAYSIIFGIETAKGFRRLIRNMKFSNCLCSWNLDESNGHLTVTVVLLLILGVVWAICIFFEKKDFDNVSSNAQLLLACIVGPFGVWMRWFLARLNGRGLEKKSFLKWVPFGTLAANVLAASIMAALATLKKAVKTNTCNTVATGIQLGFLGCLSTVSTFIAEFNAMQRSSHPWRAYAYATSTISISFALGTLIYSVPVSVNGYD